jgi:cytosine/adenosine deaminase-related metal-dependent hydrolase
MLVIRNISALYPCDRRDEAPVLGAWIEIESGRIKAVGKEPYPGADAHRSVDARGKVALPGLINMHHHFFQSLTRVIPTGMFAHAIEWLRAMYPLWQEIDAQALHAACQLTAAELLLTGTTTSIDHAYLYPAGQHDLMDTEIAAVKPLGLRIHAIRGSAPRLEGTIEHDLAADPRLAAISLVEDDDDIVAACERALEQHHETGPDSRVRIGLGPTQIPYRNPGLVRRLQALAEHTGCDRHTHLTPVPADLELCLQLNGCRPTEHLRRIGWLAPRSVLAHCTRHTAEDIASIAGTGGAVVHCPSQNIRLGTPVGPIPEMVRAGVPVAIGVDGAASNDGGGILTEMRLALLMHRLAGTHDDYGPEQWLKPQDILWMVTRGAAEILGRPELGHIASGKAADIVLVNLKQVGYAGGLHDPLACILMSADTAMVDTAIVGGDIVVEGGELRTASAARIIDDANRESARLIRQSEARTGIPFNSLAPRLAEMI